MKKALFVGSVVLLFLVFIVGTLVYNTEKVDEATATVAQNREALARPHAPTLGNHEAKVHIVEFLDPACETCAEFSSFVKQLMKAHPDKIRLSVRHAPFHQGSDQVVAALEAARNQGKYWEALEALFASQSAWTVHHLVQVERIWQPLASAGVDVARVKNEMNSAEIKALIGRDVADAKALNVTKTPEFFVNGKPMPSFGYAQLTQLVNDALAQSYR